MKTVKEIKLNDNEYESLCFMFNYDTKYNTFLIQNSEQYNKFIIKKFTGEDIYDDYVLFSKAS